MSNSAKDVEKLILEAGEKLIDPPSSLDELLSILDKLFDCLAHAGQTPPDSMKNALSPLMKALVAGKLFKHSDVDVKVAVAACISEITRITAPTPPYNDEQMKEVFKLIVSSVENLGDISSRSYSKRITILGTVAKSRSCVVLLDLECDAILVEMFQNFLKAIRDHHTGNVFSDMENIMTLVLEESEELTPKMLSPILHYVRKDDEVPQVARRLAEQVLSNSASMLQEYLTEAVESSGVSLDKYTKIVASICKGTFTALQQDQLVQNEKEDSQSHHIAKEAEVEGEQEAAVISTPTDAPKDESGKAGVSNGVAQQNDSSVDTVSTKKQDDTNSKDEPQHLDNPSNTDLDNASEERPDVEQEASVISTPTDAPKDESGKAGVSNGVTQLNDSSVDTESTKKQDDTNARDEPQHLDNPSNTDLDNASEEKLDVEQETTVISTPTDAPKDESGKAGVSNGVTQQNDSSVDTESTKKQDDTNAQDEPQHLDNPINTDLDNASEENLDVEHQPQEKEPSSATQLDSKTSDSKEESEPEALLESKDVLSLPPDDSSVKAAISSENGIEISVQALPSKTSADDTANISSPSSEDLVEESRPKNTANQKKKESSTKEAKPSAASATEEASEEPNTSEAKVTKMSGKKVASSSKAKSTVPPSKKSISEAKAAKQSEKKVVESDSVQESSKPKEEKKKSGRGKAIDEDSLDTSSDDTKKPAVSSGKSASKSKKEVKQPIEESPNTYAKRKRSLGKEKASDLQSPDGELVGSRVKVWWPKDKAYYKGVVYSYDAITVKHKVLYDDGEEEILNLKRQKWQLLDESETEDEEAADQTGHEGEASTEPQRKKAKTGKQSKMESSGKKGGGAGSSRSKATPGSKSGKKSHESKPKDSKEEDISEELSEEEENLKAVGKSAGAKSGSSKSKTTTPASKSKSGPAKSSSAKGKAAKGKAKSTPSSKDKESDSESESEETPNEPEPATKGKSVGSSGKSQASQTKSGKKRKR